MKEFKDLLGRGVAGFLLQYSIFMSSIATMEFRAEPRWASIETRIFEFFLICGY